MIPEHGKIITSTPQPDSSLVHETETFYDGQLSGYSKEIERSTLVDRQTVLRQIVEEMGIKAHKITITVHKDKSFEPTRVVVRYKEISDKLGRKR